MNCYQIAKILEISGVLIGTGLGTILLNPEVIGKLAHRINAKFLSLGDTLTERYVTIMSPILRGDVLEQLSQRLGGSMIAFLALICMLTGLIADISPLLWLGAFVVGIYVVLTVADTFIQCLRIPKRYRFLTYPLLLSFRLVLGFSIVPTVAWTLWLLNLLVAAIVIGFNAVARKDIVRRGLIMGGFLLIVSGLILEFIAIP